MGGWAMMRMTSGTGTVTTMSSLVVHLLTVVPRFLYLQYYCCLCLCLLRDLRNEGS